MYASQAFTKVTVISMLVCISKFGTCVWDDNWFLILVGGIELYEVGNAMTIILDFMN